MRIMAIGAHPDDIEISCAGTLARYKESKNDVAIVCMTDGSKGHTYIEAKELVDLRKKEAENSARIIGTEFFWMGFEDGKLENHVDIRVELLKVIRNFNPDIIITHSINDYISDHRVTSQLVTDAGSWSNVPYLEPRFKATTEVPIIIFMDTLAGVQFLPERYVDISDVFQIKKKMLMCHKTQDDWLKKFGQINYLELVEICGRYRGIQSGVQYAEGFKLWQVWLGINTDPILP